MHVSLFTCADLMSQYSMSIPSTHHFCHFQGHGSFLFADVPFGQYHGQAFGFNPTNPPKLGSLVAIYSFTSRIPLYVGKLEWILSLKCSIACVHITPSFVFYHESHLCPTFILSIPIDWLLPTPAITARKFLSAIHKRTLPTTIPISPPIYFDQYIPTEYRLPLSIYQYLRPCATDMIQ